MPNAAAIYARISSDPTGTSLGTTRQVADCRALAEQRGWTVAEVYVDDDTSAYSGKHRPAYRRLLDDLADGRRDAVIVYHLDRLHRRPKEFEEFVEACDRAGMRHVATVQGDANLGSGDGLLIARIMAAVAANESDGKSRRVRRKMQELAEHGKPHGGASRPFGYEADRITLRPVEAPIVADLAARLLAGESLASLTRWLNDQEVPTVTGRGQWRTATVRGLLRSARISGQREHRGEIVGAAVWPAIIAPADTQKIRALLDDPVRRTSRTARRYLLAGLLRCGVCGAVLLSHPRGQVRRYVCKGGAGLRGCGAITVTAEPLERFISDAVLHRLAGPALVAALSGQSSDSDDRAQQLREAIADDREQLSELAGLYADRSITAAEWKTARDRIEARIRQAEREVGRLTNTTVLDGYLGNPERLAAEWSILNLTRQAAIIKAVLDHAVIDRATVAGGAFDFRRVRPVWRF